MKFFLVIILSVGLTSPLFSQVRFNTSNLELSSGISMMLYQSVYSFQQSTAWETAIRGNVTEQWKWQVGTRLGLNPVLPDVFLGLSATPEFGFWQPWVGMELGYTNRAHFEAGDKLLRETRQAMEGDITPFYIACHSAPLSFLVAQRWRLSLMEIHIGSHLGHFGRTLRFQIGLFSLGRRL